MQKHGVIMAMEENEAVVLTTDGEFCRVTAPPAAEVGAELRWTVAKRVPLPRMRRGTSRFGQVARLGTAGLVAAAAIVAGVWRVAVHTSNQQPYAFVALDIQPGVKLTVNRQLNVLQAVALNPDGRSLLASAHVKNASLRNAVIDLVRQAADHHMIPRHDNILIATAAASTTGAANLAELQKSVVADVQVVLSSDIRAMEQQPQVYTYQVSDKVWAASEKLKVSPAKVAAYLSEIGLGRHIKLNQLHRANLSVSGSSMQLVESQVHLDSEDSQTLESIIQDAIQQMNETTTSVSPAASSSGSTGTAHNQTGSDVAKGTQLPAQLAAWQGTLPAKSHGPHDIVGTVGSSSGGRKVTPVVRS